MFDDPALAPLKAAVAEQRAEIFIDAACEAELARRSRSIRFRIVKPETGF